ncbi:MAG: hypothetical protein JXA69_08395 [Phycisphaerae bacterium]|nr:hypothetical protein [Phycisphaerae bacterium]
MRKLRFILLSLYILLILGLVLLPAVTGADPEGALIWFAMLGLNLGLQVIFVLVPAREADLKPVARRRLLAPVLGGAFLMALLMIGLGLSLFELFRIDDNGWAVILLLAPLSWLFWGGLFWALTVGRDNYHVVRKLFGWILSGTLLQLLATIPSHFIVTRRPGCLVGLLSGWGLVAGLFVLVWAFGPGVAILFWAETIKRRQGHCPGCGYDLRGLDRLRCPECGRPFTLREVRMTVADMAAGATVTAVTAHAGASPGGVTRTANPRSRLIAILIVASLLAVLGCGGLLVAFLIRICL